MERFWLRGVVGLWTLELERVPDVGNSEDNNTVSLGQLGVFASRFFFDCFHAVLHFLFIFTGTDELWNFFGVFVI